MARPTGENSSEILKSVILSHLFHGSRSSSESSVLSDISLSLRGRIRQIYSYYESNWIL
eukprot:COSAG02_NODE_7787_length_2845_cov_1.769847_3_plen_59_part_00